tara:strand:+ start:1909 stop:4722 length:2814 start_codon:yes stop_codon:yes gene_type:complete
MDLKTNIEKNSSSINMSSIIQKMNEMNGGSALLGQTNDGSIDDGSIAVIITAIAAALDTPEKVVYPYILDQTFTVAITDENADETDPSAKNDIIYTIEKQIIVKSDTESIPYSHHVTKTQNGTKEFVSNDDTIVKQLIWKLSNFNTEKLTTKEKEQEQTRRATAIGLLLGANVTLNVGDVEEDDHIKQLKSSISVMRNSNLKLKMENEKLKNLQQRLEHVEKQEAIHKKKGDDIKTVMEKLKEQMSNQIREKEEKIQKMNEEGNAAKEKQKKLSEKLEEKTKEFEDLKKAKIELIEAQKKTIEAYKNLPKTNDTTARDDLTAETQNLKSKINQITIDEANMKVKLKSMAQEKETLEMQRGEMETLTADAKERWKEAMEVKDKEMEKLNAELEQALAKQDAEEKKANALETELDEVKQALINAREDAVEAANEAETSSKAALAEAAADAKAVDTEKANEIIRLTGQLEQEKEISINLKAALAEAEEAETSSKAALAEATAEADKLKSEIDELMRLKKNVNLEWKYIFDMVSTAIDAVDATTMEDADNFRLLKTDKQILEATIKMKEKNGDEVLPKDGIFSLLQRWDEFKENLPSSQNEDLKKSNKELEGKLEELEKKNKTLHEKDKKMQAKLVEAFTQLREILNSIKERNTTNIDKQNETKQKISEFRETNASLISFLLSGWIRDKGTTERDEISKIIRAILVFNHLKSLKKEALKDLVKDVDKRLQAAKKRYATLKELLIDEEWFEEAFKATNVKSKSYKNDINTLLRLIVHLNFDLEKVDNFKDKGTIGKSLSTLVQIIKKNSTNPAPVDPLKLTTNVTPGAPYLLSKSTHEQEESAKAFIDTITGISNNDDDHDDIDLNQISFDTDNSQDIALFAVLKQWSDMVNQFPSVSLGATARVVRPEGRGGSKKTKKKYVYKLIKHGNRTNRRYEKERST